MLFCKNNPDKVVSFVQEIEVQNSHFKAPEALILNIHVNSAISIIPLKTYSNVKSTRGFWFLVRFLFGLP